MERECLRMGRESGGGGVGDPSELGGFTRVWHGNTTCRRALPLGWCRVKTDLLRSLGGFGLCLLGAALASRRGEPMEEGAAELEAALRPGLRERVALDFADARRLEWQYHYYDWPGVTLGELEPREQERFDQLLRSALSERGLEKVKGVIRLQGWLHEESGRIA